MAVENRHTDALACDRDIVSGNDHAVLDMAENAQRLFLALLLFPADIRDDISDHLGPVLEILSCAGNCLISGDNSLIGLKFFPCRKGRRITLDRAVGLDGDESAFCAKSPLLEFDHFAVLRIDLRDDHGNIRCPAVRAVVGDYRSLCFGIFFLDGTDLVLLHIHGAEAEINFRCYCLHVLHIFDNDLPYGFRDRSIHLPSSGDTFFISLAGASGARRDRCYLKPGVIFQERDKPLADHTCSAEDANTKFLVHFHFLHLSTSR